MLPLKAFFAVTAVAAVAVQARNVTISNVEPQRTVSGAIMDAHDGHTFAVDGQYLRFAASYGNCTEPLGPDGCIDAKPGKCGFQLNHNVSVFNTSDLSTWSDGKVVFETAKAGLDEAVLFCPKVIRHPKTGEFVLWFNYIVGSDFTHSFYAVAVSTTANGPFNIVNRNVTLGHDNIGDFSLFVDDDGTGYIIYTSHITGTAPTHRMSVEQLTPDFRGSLGLQKSSGYFGDSGEAPAFFKRDGVYYAVWGPCCCYCEWGSSVISHTAAHPLGPWATRNKVDHILTESAGRQARLITGIDEVAPLTKTRINAQQTDVFSVETPSGTAYLWAGDRWQQAPDHVKGHDPTYIGLLRFASDGNITALEWQDSFELDVLPPQ